VPGVFAPADVFPAGVAPAELGSVLRPPGASEAGVMGSGSGAGGAGIVGSVVGRFGDDGVVDVVVDDDEGELLFPPPAAGVFAGVGLAAVDGPGTAVVCPGGAVSPPELDGTFQFPRPVPVDAPAEGERETVGCGCGRAVGGDVVARPPGAGLLLPVGCGVVRPPAGVGSLVAVG
jgi:hypothetical protein